MCGGIQYTDKANKTWKVYFPSPKAVLRRLGYEKEEMTGHGFRSMASTILHEQVWPHEAIERRLAHIERNKISSAYNYAD
jgi:hypothetical protein